MRVNRQYEEEYQSSIKQMNEAIQALSDHLRSAEQSEDGIHYLTSDEQTLYDAEQAAMTRYHDVRAKYYMEEA